MLTDKRYGRTTRGKQQRAGRTDLPQADQMDGGADCQRTRPVNAISVRGLYTYRLLCNSVVLKVLPSAATCATCARPTSCSSCCAIF